MNENQRRALMFVQAIIFSLIVVTLAKVSGGYDLTTISALVLFIIAGFIFVNTE